ncbi:hypothetical protein [Streptomyces sp. NPDC055036]
MNEARALKTLAACSSGREAAEDTGPVDDRVNMWGKKHVDYPHHTSTRRLPACDTEA